jgi:FKBP-type peptidyl-prolyl cis-trans isomerase
MSRRTLGLLATIASCAIACRSAGGAAAVDQVAFAPGLGVDLSAMTASSGLHYRDIVVGPGAQARPGNVVSVYYTGWLTNGVPFDSTRPPEPPIRFTLGEGQVIRGWERGVTGMRVGGQRQLVVPPTLGYGNQRVNSVPPRSTLVFTIEVVEVR